jgi:hypothetical protein
MVTWVVQRQTEDRREQWNQKIRTACLSKHHNYIEIDIVPFERSVVGGDPIIDGPIVVHGSTAIFDVVERNNWNPGVFRIYKESDTLAAIGDHYLNHDMKVLDVEEVVSYVQSQGMEFFFAKPDRDLKSFDGTVFDAEKFPFFMERVKQYANYHPDTKVCVSSIKHPEVEWRFVIVEGKVVAFSQYRVNRRLDIRNQTEKFAVDFAEYIASFASPSDVFVMDVCKIGREYKVIEYNTFNCSGLYACNVYETVDAINHYVEKKYDTQGNAV